MQYSSHNYWRFSDVTPIKVLINTPSSGDANKLLRFIRPVRSANIEDSTDSGIIFAKRTILGSCVYAEYNVSVIVDDNIKKTTGGMPK